MISEPKSFVQRLFKRFLSEESYQDMQRESQQWVMQCPNCKFERSIWELGGIRWKAAGNPRMYRACPNCGQMSWQLVYKKS